MGRHRHALHQISPGDLPPQIYGCLDLLESTTRDGVKAHSWFRPSSSRTEWTELNWPVARVGSIAFCLVTTLPPVRYDVGGTDQYGGGMLRPEGGQRHGGEIVVSPGQYYWPPFTLYIGTSGVLVVRDVTRCHSVTWWKYFCQLLPVSLLLLYCVSLSVRTNIRIKQKIALCLYFGQCSVLSVSLSCPTACLLAFKLIIIGRIKMDGWMDKACRH